MPAPGRIAAGFACGSAGPSRLWGWGCDQSAPRPMGLAGAFHRGAAAKRCGRCRANLPQGSVANSATTAPRCRRTAAAAGQRLPRRHRMARPLVAVRNSRRCKAQFHGFARHRHAAGGGGRFSRHRPAAPIARLTPPMPPSSLAGWQVVRGGQRPAGSGTAWLRWWRQQAQ